MIADTRGGSSAGAPPGHADRAVANPDALEMALWTRAPDGQDVDGLVHHSDAGSRYTEPTPDRRQASRGTGTSNEAPAWTKVCERTLIPPELRWLGLPPRLAEDHRFCPARHPSQDDLGVDGGVVVAMGVASTGTTRAGQAGSAGREFSLGFESRLHRQLGGCAISLTSSAHTGP
jgi:hypothetical protein